MGGLFYGIKRRVYGIKMCSTQVNGSDFVNDMNGGLYLSLINILDENDNWKNLIQVIPPEIYTANDVQKFHKSTQKLGDSPGRAVLRDLGDRIIIEELVSYLEKLQLAKALLLFKRHEAVTVTMSPSSQCEVSSGRRSHLKLQCMAQGFPGPTFQWFRKPKDQDIIEELLLQRQPMLDISPVRKQDEGAYICKISNQNPENNEESAAWTQWCIVTVNEISSDEDDELPDLPVITEHPKSPNCDGHVEKGSSVILQCLAKSYWPLSYEWYRNGVTIENEIRHELKLNNISEENKETQWTFQCRVYNKCGSVLSEPVLIKLGNLSDDVAFVEDKVALLIANQSYTNLNPLRLPGEDARSLAIRLQNLGFKVITLIDLTKQEMEKALDDFCQLLDTGVIGLFYYVGHGFEINRTCYLLPVDATSDFLRSGSLSSEYVLSKMQAHDIALCLIMLDTCRLEPQMNMAVHMETLPLFRSMVRRNLVYAYSTSYSCAAYESKTGRNGVFMKYLKKYISQDIPIQNVFFHVAKDVATDPIASKKQYPWLETNLARRCSLATKIQQTLPSSAARNSFYTRITALPEMIKFKIGTCQTGDLSFNKYKDVFCNAMTAMAKCNEGRELKLAAWNLSPLNVDITVTAAKEKSQSHTNKLYLIQGLQKLQDQLRLKFTVNSHSCHLQLGYPLIAQANRQETP